MGTRGGSQAFTDAQGTFALRGDGVQAVRIACRYCLATVVAVTPGEPVVAIVRRYGALLEGAPSPEDVAALPYTHVESTVALRPFTLLQQSSIAYVGSALSDRGLEPADALLIDAGVPNYDVVFGTSPYATIPAMYEQNVAVASASNAFLYGDRAGSGIVDLTPFGDANSEAALLGNNATLRLQAGSNASGVVVGSFSDDVQSTQRGDAQITLPISSAQSLALSGGTSQGRQYEAGAISTADSFSFARALYDDRQPTIDLYASYVTDRGAYTANGASVGDIWSDSSFMAGARTLGSVAFFADISSRSSSGLFDAQSYQMPRIAGALEQDRLDAGIDASGKAYAVTGGVGLFGIDYAGGTGGFSAPSTAHLAVPSLQAQLFPNQRWSATLEGSGSFTLPDLWQQYGYDDNYQTLTYDRNTLYAAALTYSDDSRLRVSFETASQRVTGYSNGLVTSGGVAMTWQLSPLISVRAWTMHVADAVARTSQAPYAGSQIEPTVSAYWLTYDNDALRVDAIYREDLLNAQPYRHFDGDISGPISRRLRWYVGSEDWQHRPTVDVGLRFNQ